ncbi:MAG TPA: ROK family protein [Solirubrobacteraceae bacterium]|nr:ROK family protein [Solirubrobacteraceae bacterium]
MRLLGVDVGGTKVAVAALEDGRLGESASTPTPTGDTDALLDDLEARIREAGSAEAVGVAVPSVIDFATGTARFSVNIPLAGVPLREVLRERLGVPVFVDNDGACAALAEALGEEADPSTDDLVMVTVGTGLGGGVVIDGRVYRGATGAAAEVGHMIVAADVTAGAPARATPPHPDSWEAWSSGGALGRLAAERGLPDGRAAVAAARRGEAGGLEAVRILGERLGVGVANLVNLLDPAVVAIGGGVSAAGDVLLEPVREVAERLMLPGVGTRTEIRLARRGGEAGVLGAALLAGQEREREETAA